MRLFLLFVTIAFYLPFSQPLQASDSGIYHNLLLTPNCQEKIFRENESGQKNNYRKFLTQLISELHEKENDACTMAKITNMRGFINWLIENNDVASYKSFFVEANILYQERVAAEKNRNLTCEFHSFKKGTSHTNYCMSDYVMGLFIFSQRIWLNYFLEPIQDDWALYQSIAALGGVGAVGLGAVSFLGGGHLRRGAVKLLRSSYTRLRVFFTQTGGNHFRTFVARNGGVLARGGTVGGAAPLSQKLTEEEFLELRKKMDHFFPPLEFMDAPEELDLDRFLDDGDLTPTFLQDSIDVVSIIAAGVLPVFAAEKLLLELAVMAEMSYLVSSLSKGFWSRVAFHTTTVLRSPISKIAAGVTAGFTVGSFWVKEHEREKFKDNLIKLHSLRLALKEEIKNRNPYDPWTVLLAEKLVGVSEKLSLIYASVVVYKLEALFARYSTLSLCTPLKEVNMGASDGAYEDYFINKYLGPKLEEEINEIFTEKRISWFLKIQNLVQQMREFDVNGKKFTFSDDLFHGEDPIYLAFQVLLDTKSFLTHEITVQGQPVREYLSLKSRLYRISQYLLSFKSPDRFKENLRLAVNKSFLTGRKYAKPLKSFYQDFKNSHPPEFREIPVNSWKKYLESQYFFQKVKSESEMTGYSFACDYFQFPTYFTDFDLTYKKVIPCHKNELQKSPYCQSQ